MRERMDDFAGMREIIEGTHRRYLSLAIGALVIALVMLAAGLGLQQPMTINMAMAMLGMGISALVIVKDLESQLQEFEEGQEDE